MDKLVSGNKIQPCHFKNKNYSLWEKKSAEGMFHVSQWLAYYL